MSFVKYQHYLARKHMSWFSNPDLTNSFWSLTEMTLLDNMQLTEIGGQNHLYESEKLPRNFVEKEILGKVETDFFDARGRAVVDKSVRISGDRQAVRRYAAAQILRDGYLHKRLVQFEQDLRFLAKEMDLERIWQVDKLPEKGGRKRASALLASGLIELDEMAASLKDHVVTFVDRPEGDLLLPDRGLVQIYEEYGKLRTDGMKSASLKIYIPIAPDAALKLFRPPKKSSFPNRTRMSDETYVLFLKNLGFNAKQFVVGTKAVLTATDWNSVPYFDPHAERISMIMQLKKGGVFDGIIADFHAAMMSDHPLAKIREWFYEEKFVPAMNKLFNPDNDPRAETISFPL